MTTPPYPDQPAPITRASLTEDLRGIGVRPGSTLLVHCALSKVGWILGGAPTLITALIDVLGDEGTLMMPTHSSDLTEPSNWSRPPVPPQWFETIRREMPAFDPATTPTREMGALAETFRRWPGAARSAHPYGSFAALGPAADALLAGHAPSDAFGETSPLAGLYAADGDVLLLGVGHGNDTSLHLAEARASWPGKVRHEEGSPVLVDGERTWLRYEELKHDDADFVTIGDAFEAAEPGGTQHGRIGKAEARRIRQRALVDFATTWMTANRA